MRQYDHKKIEGRWQKEWEKKAIYRSKETRGKKKAYILDMFPYPSGEGLHVGHPKGYIATDIFSRWSRMQGRSVLHPMGWDAFGLPAENFAIKNKIHPRKAVEKNIKRFKEQLRVIGLDYDWSREINTTDPQFYKWTQWIFLKLYEKGLAYQSFEPINWCPSCQTGLANEDLDGNACERCGTIVEKRPMRQWILKITDYAERLLKDLELLPEWQEHIKESQRNWIGRSEGAEIDFELSNGDKVRVFTTRPDTLFGATYLVLAPEHPMLNRLGGILENAKEVEKYAKAAGKKTELERQEGKEKTGVKLQGVEATNPATGGKIPLYIADYVLAHYGTGAIMAVPAHDERDYEFAEKFSLPIVPVIAREHIDALRPAVEGKPIEERTAVQTIVKHPTDEKYLLLKLKGWGVDTYSLPIGGIEEGEEPMEAAHRELAEETGFTDLVDVRPVAAPYFALFHHDFKGVNRRAKVFNFAGRLKSLKQEAISAEEEAKHELQWVSLDEMHRKLDGQGVQEVVRVFRDGEGAATGEGILINSGPFDGLTTGDAKRAITERFGAAKTTYKIRDWVFSRQRYWGEPIPIIHCDACGVVPVPEKDLPVKLPEVKKYAPTGTGESPLAAIAKWVNVKCPKCKGRAKRETNTMPQWAGSSWYWLRYMDPKNKKALVDKKKEKYWAPVDLYVGGAEHATRHLIYGRFWHKFLYDIKVVSTPEPFTRLISVGLIMAEDGRKMSKRYGNVINPDDIVKTYGADTLRVYEMFMGPFTDAIAWKTSSLIGARRFLERVWRLQGRFNAKPDADVERELHKTIKKTGEDIRNFKFNTAISQMMIFINLAEKQGVTKAQYGTFLKILAPFAPHIAEELWRTLGNRKTIHLERWPKFDAKKTVQSTVTIVVQVNGKTRAQIQAAAGADEKEVQPLAEKAAVKWLGSATYRKVVFVPDRLINFVV